MAGSMALEKVPLEVLKGDSILWAVSKKEVWGRSSRGSTQGDVYEGSSWECFLRVIS